MKRNFLPMPKETLTDQCSNLTQSMTIDIPHSLAERAEKYARENRTTLPCVVIEALAVFLRERNLE
jgi:hypothetical protein